MPSAFSHRGGAGLTIGARGVANDAAGPAAAQGGTMGLGDIARHLKSHSCDVLRYLSEPIAARACPPRPAVALSREQLANCDYQQRGRRNQKRHLYHAVRSQFGSV